MPPGGSRQSINRSVAEQARTIRIPVHLFESITRILRVQRMLTQELGSRSHQRRAGPGGGLSAGFGCTSHSACTLGRQHLCLLTCNEGLRYATLKIDRVLRSAEEPVSIDGPVGDEELQFAG